MARSQKTQSEAQKEAQLQMSNECLLLALQSAQMRGLLELPLDKKTGGLNIARKISIAAGKYYRAKTGEMTQDELRTAIEAVFNYESKKDDGITAC